MQEKIIEMLKMQDALNEEVKRTFDLETIEFDNLKLALIDEVGELTHELKGYWCWWKKTQKPVEREKVLEELVDVVHFAMTYHITISGVKFDMDNFKIAKMESKDAAVSTVLGLIAICTCPLYYTLILVDKLGFSFDDVYNAYIDKNKVNYERLNNGY